MWVGPGALCRDGPVWGPVKSPAAPPVVEPVIGPLMSPVSRPVLDRPAMGLAVGPVLRPLPAHIFTVLRQQVVDPHIQCSREGVQVRAHAENLQAQSVISHPELGHPHPTSGGPHPLELTI